MCFRVKSLKTFPQQNQQLFSWRLSSLDLRFKSCTVFAPSDEWKVIKICSCCRPNAALTFRPPLFAHLLHSAALKLFRVLLIKSRRKLLSLRFNCLHDNELIRAAAAFQQIFSSCLQLLTLSAAAPAELCLPQACVGR